MSPINEEIILESMRQTAKLAMGEIERDLKEYDEKRFPVPDEPNPFVAAVKNYIEALEKFSGLAQKKN